MEFILELADDFKITGPTDEQIRQAIMSLDTAQDAAFAILGPRSDPNTYIQTTGDARSGFGLEHQAGDTKQHFMVATECDAEQIIAAFIAYRDGNDHWRNQFQWEHIPL